MERLAVVLQGLFHRRCLRTVDKEALVGSLLKLVGSGDHSSLPIPSVVVAFHRGSTCSRKSGSG